MDPKDYALLLGDQSLLIPLDRTVASLQGKRELLLVKRSMLPQYGEDIVRGIGKTTDPNGQSVPIILVGTAVLILFIFIASIFKRMSDTPDTQFASTDYTTAYKARKSFESGSIPFSKSSQKYTIYRKMPMLVAKQERTLAIDGVYVHVG